jgi:hypothetical protein
VVERLAESGGEFGNGPEDPNNGETGGPLGGQERVYFASPDGHPIEVTAGELSV